MSRFNQTGYVARFTREKGKPDTTLDVVGWHPETGDALVVDTATGQLRAAGGVRGFVRLDAVDTIVGTLPAEGWRAVWWRDGAQAVVEPIAGWVVTGDGCAYPIGVDAGEMYGDAITGLPGEIEGVELLPPGRELPDADPAVRAA
ncbi:hypothetical protein SAMN06297387_11218 [Streptomyces zhaozhouensis]|uniref:Uncharacterized protein n=1 Tax=Streptomyces zhaozhouensis TaxID=1300267 RepID=A0A286DYD6_9ACTN|nr:hypothetical protein [Streptomyces zhaozhouensis]SOD63665.1 hypothetical protein SAMN06297387_11218 [Streptomyces zhaozhouensis]